MTAMPVELPNENLEDTMSSTTKRATPSVTGNRVLVLGTLFCLLLTGCRDAFVPTGPAARRVELAPPTVVKRVAVHGTSRRIPDEYIVVFDNTVTDVGGRAKALSEIAGGTMHFTFVNALHGFSAHMSAQAAEAIADHPGVQYVEQDQHVQATDYAPSWGLDRTDQTLLPLDQQYTYTSTGSGVSAYIIDTGIRTTHAQFGGRAFSGFSSVADSYGANDCHGHGTHVAGTLGGAQVGIAKAVKLYAVRVLDCNGSGTISGVIAGVDWVTANRHLPAVANMSLVGDYSDALNAAVQNSINSGVTYAVAAGNAATDACSYSPSSLDGAITVAASTVGDEQASYSNFGACVDIFAPGTSIVSAWNTSDDVLLKMSGTSMASPHVAGAAALYLQNNPSASPAQVAQALVTSATTNALSLVPSNTVNRLLRVNGPADGAILPPVSAPPPSTNLPPTAMFSISCASQKNYCSFDASASSDDNRIVSYSWNFGDRTSAVTAGNPMTSHMYSTKGTFIVTLSVTDEAGLVATTQRSVLVKSVSRR